MKLLAWKKKGRKQEEKKRNSNYNNTNTRTTLLHNFVEVLTMRIIFPCLQVSTDLKQSVALSNFKGAYF